MAWNYWGSYDFLGLLGAGRIPLAIFYLAWIAAGIHCIIVRAWGKQRDPLFPAPRLPFAGSIRHCPANWTTRASLCRRTAAGCVTVFSVRSSLPAWRLLKGSRLQQWTPRCSTLWRPCRGHHAKTRGQVLAAQDLLHIFSPR